jgi:hypothetical protein
MHLGKKLKTTTKDSGLDGWCSGLDGWCSGREMN